MNRHPIKRRPIRAATRKKAVKQPNKALSRIFLGFFFLVIVGALVAAIWYGSRLEMFTITSVKVEGGETISHEVVLELVEEELEGEHHRLIPKRFFFTYPKETIVSKISSIPRVKNINVEEVNKNTILVEISEYYPFALWCNHLDNESESLDCFFLDAEGYSFIESPPLSGSSMLRYYDPALTAEKGTHPFSAGFMNDTSLLAVALGKDLGLRVSHVERTAPDEASLHLVGGGIIKVSLQQSVDSTVSNLAAILGSNEFNHLEPGNFQYIDLRFGNKVFVNEEVESLELTSTSTATSTVEIDS